MVLLKHRSILTHSTAMPELHARKRWGWAGAIRYKILAEVKSFPSDKFVFESQIRLHGLDPADALIEVRGTLLTVISLVGRMHCENYTNAHRYKVCSAKKDVHAFGRGQMCAVKIARGPFVGLSVCRRFVGLSSVCRRFVG